MGILAINGKVVLANGQPIVSSDSGGDTVTDVAPNDITFCDYDGTVVAAWALDELSSKTALPDYPTHSGLVCQGWNWTLEDLKSANTKVVVGAQYITDDAKTHIYIHLEDGRTSPMLGCCPNGMVLVDWGDGTSADTLTGTNIGTVQWTPTHNYATAGDYVITLTVTGTVGFIGQSSTDAYSCLLRQTSGADGRNMYYLNCIQKIEFGANVALGARALMYCSAIKSITVPKSISMTGSIAMQNCVRLPFFSIPDGVTAIQNDVFRACSNLRTVAIPKSVVSIGAAAFLQDTLLWRISIPSGVTSLGANVFYTDTSLTEIAIPAGVTQILASAFINAYGVKIYDFSKHTAVPMLANTNAFTGIAEDCQIRVPSSLVDDWKAAANWANLADYIVGV